MDGQSYYESLLAQGYGPEAATQFTQQHYPGFGQAPAAPQPIAMPAPQPMAAPAPLGVVMHDSVISGGLQQSVTNINNVTTNIVGNQSTNTSKGMRITNGIFGILMSFALIGWSLFVIGIWAEASDEIESDLDLLDDLDIDEVNDFTDGIDSFLSTISYFYYAIILFSIITLVISVMQFLDKPWGTKALLGSTGILLVLLLATGAYEASSFEGIGDDYEDLTGESIGGEMPSFFEVSGTIGGYCAGLCFVVYGLLALIGRPKSPPVQVVMN